MSLGSRKIHRKIRPSFRFTFSIEKVRSSLMINSEGNISGVGVEAILGVIGLKHSDVCNETISDETNRQHRGKQIRKD